MKKKIKLGILAIAMCMLCGNITAFAATENFNFVIRPTEYDSGTWLAQKADGEQRAYITPTSITGIGRVWVAVYDQNGGTQYTSDVAIQPGSTYRHITEYNYGRTGYAGVTYRLMGGDPEWEVTSNTFKVSGRWTP